MRKYETLTRTSVHPSPLPLSRYQDEIYKFDHWVATSVSTGKAKVVARTIYEETADGDYAVEARYVKTKMAAMDDPTLGVPANVQADGEFERVSVTWEPHAPGPNAPDFITISIRDATTHELVKEHMTTAAKGAVVLPLPSAPADYTVDMSWVSSSRNARGIRTWPVAFSSKAELTTGKLACLAGTQFAEELKSSPIAGLGDQYQIALLGTYPTTLAQGQQVRLTFDVVSATASQLMVNILDKNDYSWLAGKVVNIPAKTERIVVVDFTIDTEVGLTVPPDCLLDAADPLPLRSISSLLCLPQVTHKAEYFIDALLIQDAKDYTSALVEDTSAGGIVGIAVPDATPVAATTTIPVPAGTTPNSPLQPTQPGALAGPRREPGDETPKQPTAVVAAANP